MRGSSIVIDNNATGKTRFVCGDLSKVMGIAKLRGSVITGGGTSKLQMTLYPGFLEVAEDSGDEIDLTKSVEIMFYEGSVFLYVNGKRCRDVIAMRFSALPRKPCKLFVLVSSKKTKRVLKKSVKFPVTIVCSEDKQ